MFLIGSKDPIWRGWPFGSSLGHSAGGEAQARAAISLGATVLFAGHSFVQTSFGEPIPGDSFGGLFQTDWPGTVLADYIPYASMQQIWEFGGNLRNGAYDAVIVTEFTPDFVNGFPAVDSDATRNTLQHLYWAGRAAQARGAEIILQDVWSPQGTDLTANVRGYFQFLRGWLQDKLGQRVWIVPANAFVMALRDLYGDVIYDDGLHLGRGSRYARALSYMVCSMLTQQRCPFVREGEEELDQIGWEVLLSHECAGMGGEIVYAAAPGEDPLPDPEPLPAQSHPLQPYYDSAAILIHLSSDGVTLDGDGNAAGLTNHGLAGSMFDAMVVGPPIPLDGELLTITNGGGYPQLLMPADLFGVRLMWVCSTEGLRIGTSGTVNFFGYSGDDYGNALRKAANGQGTGNRIQSWSNQTGAGLAQNTGLHALPDTGLHLFEAEVSTNTLRTYVDGVLVGSTVQSSGWTAFLIDRVGRGHEDSVSPFTGQMGDVLGVTLDHPHTEAAIAAARTYLNDRFDLGLVL
ncbi:hypothetical protein [Paracoccus sp. (in: a-proteobacteria)]|uniref:hypothetical protein n=1 Tax=Paracoccus sp. TaxID=267 RepID=UPI0028AA54CA|nr:hypothetical protein [Paracoccus sp. (in: a-proteobacteria)]